MGRAIWSIFTARRYAKRAICRRRVSVRVSVCVCVSVTLRYCIKTAKRRITQLMPHTDVSICDEFEHVKAWASDDKGCPHCMCAFVTLNKKITYLLTYDRSATLVYTDKRVARSLCHSRATCDTILECDRHACTHRHTTTAYSALSIASRGKNRFTITEVTTSDFFSETLCIYRIS